MKHNSSIEFTECMGVQIAHSIHPNITKEDIDIIVEELLRAGMRSIYREPNTAKDIMFVGVDYKKPVIFVDDDGKKFCVGYYSHNLDPAKVSERIMEIVISKSYQRLKSAVDENPDEDWHVNYCIQFYCKGHTWVLGRKKVICGHTPKGMTMVYRMASSMEPLRAEIRHNIETIKRYIDGGKPVLKS